MDNGLFFVRRDNPPLAAATAFRLQSGAKQACAAYVLRQKNRKNPEIQDFPSEDSSSEIESREIDCCAEQNRETRERNKSEEGAGSGAADCFCPREGQAPPG